MKRKYPTKESERKNLKYYYRTYSEKAKKNLDSLYKTGGDIIGDVGDFSKKTIKNTGKAFKYTGKAIGDSVDWGLYNTGLFVGSACAIHTGLCIYNAVAPQFGLDPLPLPLTENFAPEDYIFPATSGAVASASSFGGWHVTRKRRKEGKIQREQLEKANEITKDLRKRVREGNIMTKELQMEIRMHHKKYRSVIRKLVKKVDQFDEREKILIESITELWKYLPKKKEKEFEERISSVANPPFKKPKYPK